MKLKTIVSIMCASVMFSCTDLDMSPVNVVNEEDLFANEAGTLSYISGMYMNLPLEDFRYAYEGNPPFNYAWTIYAQPSCRTGEAIGRDAAGNEYEAVGYWNQAYSYIRAANLLLEVLPKYASNYTEAQANSFLGEAYFIRSMVYYSLVKRYGGVPVVDKVIDYPASVSFEDTKLFRASEEDTWDFIGADLDKAIELLPESNQKGRANKYAAAALKSRIMLHAGSIAKYNTVNYAPVNGVRVCGIPQEKAVGYFKAAYEVSQIVDEGGYRLYMDKWSGNNRQAQIDNFTAIFLEDTYETIFGRYYIDPEFLHQFDNSAQPMGALLKESDNYSSNYNVAVDENTVKLVNSFSQNNDDSYLVQLKSGSKYWNDLADRYPDKKDIYAGKMRRSGASGPVSNWDYGNLSGFYLRKYMKLFISTMDRDSLCGSTSESCRSGMGTCFFRRSC